MEKFKDLKFTSPEQFLAYLIKNEGTIIGDAYGRQWYYKKFDFYFKDIGDNDVFEKGLKCLHLYGSKIRTI